jgi:peptidoglycan/xylan/chitin deacetylase (PgdA/CDA1 family)
MLLSKQDLCLLAFYYLGFSGTRNLVLRFLGKSVARFVTFHDIPNGADSSFEAALRFLKENTNVISLDDYFARKLSCKRINVVITFDDGYKSWISKAVPALKEHGLPATFFVSSGFLSLSKEEEAEFIRSRLKTCRKTTGGLSAEDVRKIAQENFAIGGHTYNHVNLAEIQDRVELKREILLDKQRLESIIGKEIRYFAYPFGVHRNPNTDLIEVLKEAGYRGAVTTISGFNTAGSNSHLLCRELTGVPTPLCVLKARVRGTYDVVKILKNQAKKLFWPWNDSWSL